VTVAVDFLDRVEHASEAPWLPVEAPGSKPVEAEAGPSLASKWAHGPIEEAVGILVGLGRTYEVEILQEALGVVSADEKAIDGFVSDLWAEDWSSPEDAIFDTW